MNDLDYHKVKYYIINNFINNFVNILFFIQLYYE